MDNMQGIDPKYLALIQAGAGILAANNGRVPAGAAIGQGLLGGAGAYQEGLQNQQMMQMRNDQIQSQRQLFQARADEIAQDKRDKEQKNTTLQGVAQQYGLDPNVVSAFPKIGEDLITSKLIPKAPKIGFTPNGVAYDENNPNLKVGESYAKLNDNMPSAVQEYEYAKGQGYKGSYVDFQLAQKRAGASNVSVNTGQKGFDNTLKLRGDFRSEPIYKAHQEVQAAHAQITAALKKASPAGDLAGATKLMKILDPGSVVRESELGMAMAASGKLDRLENYGSMLLSGNKLTPKQREDFQALADELANESAMQYNTKREEYKGIANRNELNELDVLGNPEKIKPTKNSAMGGGWSVRKVK